MKSTKMYFISFFVIFFIYANLFPQIAEHKSPAQQSIINRIESVTASTTEPRERFGRLMDFINSADFDSLHYVTRIRYLKAAENLLSAPRPDFLKLRISLLTAECFMHLAEFNRTIAIIDSLNPVLSPENNLKFYAKALELKGFSLERLNFNDSSLAYLTRLHNLALENFDIELEYTALMRLAEYFSKVGENYNSISYINRASEIAADQNNIDKLRDTRTQIGNILIYAGEKQLGIKNFKEALVYAKQSGDLKSVLLLEALIGRFSKEIPKEEKIVRVRKCINYLEKYGYAQQLAREYDQLGKYYFRMGIFDESRYFSRKALEISVPGKQIRVNLNIYHRLAKMDIAEKKFQSAYANLVKSEDYLLPKQKPEYGAFLYEVFEDYYLALGDYESAHKYLRKSYDAYHLSRDIETKRKMAVNFALHDLREQKDREIEDEKQKSETLLTERNFSILSLLGISFTIFIALYFSLKISKERKKNLADQNEKNKLISAQKDNLDKLDQMKNRFFSVLAHDLRGPVGNILRLSGLIRLKSKERGDEEFSKIGSLLNESSKNIDNLLKSMLIWGKIQMKVAKPVRSEYFLKHRIDGIVNSLSAGIRNKNITIEKQIHDSHTALADEGMIDTVIRNLIYNAVKFSHNGGTVKIESHRMNGKLLVSIIDNGIGIEEKKLDAIYNPVPVNQNSSDRMSGLGLILSKEFVNLNGGELIIETKVGKGTKISFSLDAEEPEFETLGGHSPQIASGEAAELENTTVL